MLYRFDGLEAQSLAANELRSISVVHERDTMTAFCEALRDCLERSQMTRKGGRDGGEMHRARAREVRAELRSSGSQSSLRRVERNSLRNRASGAAYKKPKEIPESRDLIS